jgi:hypothetical protein
MPAVVSPPMAVKLPLTPFVAATEMRFTVPLTPLGVTLLPLPEASYQILLAESKSTPTYLANKPLVTGSTVASVVYVYLTITTPDPPAPPS